LTDDEIWSRATTSSILLKEPGEVADSRHS
jgi:hypothetical protein